MSAVTRTYFPNLDATRFLAFLHVFLAHCFFTTSPEIASGTAYKVATVNIKAGFLGLDYFFVLSAFLLTWLALEERAATNTFRPLLFMIRRALRLWPLYLLIVLAVYATQALTHAFAPLPPIHVFLLFYSNFWMINHGQDFLFLLVFFWSIAVEEQFYLVWAFLLWAFRKYLIAICLLMIFSSLAFRAYNLHDNQNLVFHTLSVVGNFGTGALAAILAFNKGPLYRVFKEIPRTVIALVYLGLLLLTVFYFRLFDYGWPVVIEKQVFSLFFVFIILEQSFSPNRLLNFGSYRVLNYMGRISLGLYCYHGVVLTLLMPWLKSIGLAYDYRGVFLLNPLIILLTTLLISVASFELFEKHIHGLRRYFYPAKS